MPKPRHPLPAHRARPRGPRRGAGGDPARGAVARRVHRRRAARCLRRGASLHYQGTTRMGADRRRHLGLRPEQRGLGRRRPLRRRQQRHPDPDRLQPHAHVGGARRRRGPATSPRGWPPVRTPCWPRPPKGSKTMLEFPVIQGQGFRNVVEDGRVTGFSFRLRNPNYRGGAGEPARRRRGRDRRRADPRPRAAVDPAGPHDDAGRAARVDRRPLAARRARDHHRAQAGRSLDRRALTSRSTVFLRRSYIPPLIARTTSAPRRRRCIVPPVPDGPTSSTASRPTATPATSTPR